MAYTIGTSHGPFTGTGNFVIAKPAGIRTVVTGIPFYTGRDGSSPVRYFRLGRYTLGNADGFQNSVPIEYAQQVAYPLAPDWELLAYDIRDGASCLFQELLAVPDLTARSPWDRTPTQLIQGGQASQAGAVGTTTMFTYTVPAGRRTYLPIFGCTIRRSIAATTPGTPIATLRVNGSAVIIAQLFSNVVGAESARTADGGPVLLSPGATVSGEYSSTDVGGAVLFDIRISGFLFDA
jgi:hypothetical protein